MNMRIFLALSLTVLLTKVWSQEPPNPEAEISNISIATPNTASLGKYIDFPVSYHTGIPEISIPIYNVTNGNLNLPISLSYNASGIKVAEMASWVGLGWTLNAGGMISRTIKGLPDEKETSASGDVVSFYDDHGYINYLRSSVGDLDWVNFARGHKDGEPDLFFFNFNGYTGKFYIREDNTPVIVPHQNINIEPVFCQTGEDCNASIEKLRGWKVTTPDGVRYYFGMSLDNSTHGSPAIEKTHPYSQKVGQDISTVVSSWYLYKVESADGQFVINFKYTAESYGYYSISMGAHLEAGIFTEYDVLVKNNVVGVRLNEINFPNGKVTFNVSSTPREDLSGSWSGIMQTVNTQAKPLESIEISNTLELCKRFTFDYSYFQANSNPLKGPLTGYESSGYNISCDRKRLKLNSIQEKSCTGSIELPKYNFEYFEDIALPSTLSFGVDHWGYFNGSETNEWLIPNVSNDDGATYSTVGANRESSWPEMRAGSLKKIQYPTGGKTEFDFDYDEVSIVPQGPGQIAYYKIGGLRIKEIKNTDESENVLISKQFQYPSGVILFSIPSYIYKIRNSSLWYGSGISGLTTIEGCRIWNTDQNGPTYMYKMSAGSVHPMLTTNGYHKGYEDVKVIQSDGGYSLYTYDVSGAPSITRGVSVRIINNRECTGFEPAYPAVPEDFPFARGNLVSEKKYIAGQTSPIAETHYETEYSIDQIGIHGILFSTVLTAFVPGEYQIKSGRKIRDKITSKVFDPISGEYIQTINETKYNSQFHNFPTSQAQLDNEGINPVKEVKTTYVKDFSPCNQNFQSYRDIYLQGINSAYQAFQSNISKCPDPQARATICNSLRGCNFYPLDPCYGQHWYQTDSELLFQAQFACQHCSYTEYTIAVNDVRVAYINSLLSSKESACLSNLGSVSDPLYQALRDLNKQHYVNGKVEVTQWNEGALTNAYLINYGKFQDKIYPVNTNKIDIVPPLPEAQFDAAIVISNVVQADDHYNSDKESEYKYEDGTLVEINQKNGSLNSYLWDATRNYVIAKGVGISFSDLKNAHLSALALGPVGSSVYNAQIRSLGSSGLITTYTYKSLIGIESITDHNNITTRYEYDDIGRLTLIKDQDGNILQKLGYNYKSTTN